MLYLTRKIGESLIINDEIEVTVVDVKGKSAKLGITFPQHATVLRREVYDRIQAENRAAAVASEQAVADVLAAAETLATAAARRTASTTETRDEPEPSGGRGA